VFADRANNKTMSPHPQEHVPMTTQNFTEKARPHVIEPHDTEAINQWPSAAGTRRRLQGRCGAMSLGAAPL